MSSLPEFLAALGLSEPAQDAVLGFMALGELVGKAVLAIDKAMRLEATKAERDHRRGEVLRACRRRHEWKKSDAGPLRTLDINENVRQRLSRLKGRGRPVVTRHQPLARVLEDRLTRAFDLVREDATQLDRRRAFKVWPWWKHHVEALYEGEKITARNSRIKSPADHAEREVARALGISQSRVRAICSEIRKLRADDADSANFLPMQLADYEAWMEHGKLPHIEG